MKKKLSTIILCAVFLVGLGLLLYPSVSDWWNSFHQTYAIANYAEAAAELSEEDCARLLQHAQEYNESLLSKPNPLVPSEEELAAYGDVLNVTGNGIMGYIEIPKIKCNLPIHHGVGEEVLQTAIGHIPGTSLPIGGASTHCVVSGHRGLPSAKLFTDLDQMVPGDIFMIQTLNDTLTYEVDQIRIVEPQEVNDLTIIPGGDYFTLVTCTPYGINSHRLLGTGYPDGKPAGGVLCARDLGGHADRAHAGGTHSRRAHADCPDGPVPHRRQTKTLNPPEVNKKITNLFSLGL